MPLRSPTVHNTHQKLAQDDHAIDVNASPREYFTMMRARLAEVEDEACALSTRPLLLGATNLVSDRIRDAASLGDAMRLSAQTYNLLHGGHYNRIVRQGDRILYRIDDSDFPFAFNEAPLARATVMEGVVIFLHTWLSIWAGRDLTSYLRAVHSRRSQRGGDSMLNYWAAPVRLGAKAYILEYTEAADNLVPVVPAPTPTLIGVYDRILANVDQSGAIMVGPGDVVSRVRSHLQTGLNRQSDVARALGMSVASLRRRLAEDGHDFRHIRSEILNGRAHRLLENGQPPDAVADLLGFADSRSFARAFKQWNGITPARFAANTLSEYVLSDCASASSTRQSSSL